MGYFEARFRVLVAGSKIFLRFEDLGVFRGSGLCAQGLRPDPLIEVRTFLSGSGP